MSVRPLVLSSQAYGDAGRPIVILHGLLGSGRNWSTIAKQLGETYQVFTLDLRNHGGSPWSDEMTYDAMAADVAHFIDESNLGPVNLIGHSMGGKTSMRLALDRPSLIERLVVVDIAPVAYEHSSASYVEAMRAIDVEQYVNRKDIDALLSAAVPEAGIRAFLLQNLVREDRGFSWRANLDGLAKAMPALMAFPSTGKDPFERQTMFLAGKNSDYVLPSHQGEVARLFPSAKTHHIADAGHWLHAEQPAVFLEMLQEFLSTPSR